MEKLTFQDIQTLYKRTRDFESLQRLINRILDAKKASENDGYMSITFNAFPIYDDTVVGDSERLLPRELKDKIIDTVLDFYNDELARLTDTLALDGITTEKATANVCLSMNPCAESYYITDAVENNTVVWNTNMSAFQVKFSYEHYKEPPKETAAVEDKGNIYWDAIKDMANK